MARTLKNFLNDETGAAALEYALVVGLVVIGIFSVVSSLGTKVLAKWHSLDSALNE
jgi:pilus assembly protein Flp/PilA